MAYVKATLSEDEQRVHVELLALAGGMGCMKELTVLNDHQKEVMSHLNRKGYVTLTKRKFMVVLPV
jgi:hypothetical protein